MRKGISTLTSTGLVFLLLFGQFQIFGKAATRALPLQAKAAHSLTVGEGFDDPVGFYDATPVFSWKLPIGVVKQTAYRIETKTGERTWDSGWIESDRSTLVPYGGDPFASRDHVEWRVRFRDQNRHESEWSETSRFELGLLSAKDWQAQWIRPSGKSDQKVEAVSYLRRQFALEKKVAKARLYVTARGIFQLKLNGLRVGNDHFANGMTAYDKRLDTLTYDVGAKLRDSANTIEATLGNGWYSGRFPFSTNVKGPFGKDPELLLQLEITYGDGSRSVISSDKSWQGTFKGPIISSSIYDGETYDARKEIKDWKPVQANPALGSARLTPKPFATVKETRQLTVQKITQPRPGTHVFDLGQNMVGWAKLKIPVKKDKRVTIRFAEMLNKDGTLYTENYRTAKSTDVYTAAQNATVEWEPQFTFHGFRYVELTGIAEGESPQPAWVTGIVLHSDLPQTGTFESSDAKLNQLQSNIVWGWRGNSLDIPTDCPQRDERTGWTGDAQVFCPTSMFNTDAHAFWRSWLSSMRDDQDADGLIPDIIPNMNQTMRNRSPGWVDAATMVPWEVYVRTGDERVLAENFSMMERMVGWYRNKVAEDGIVNINDATGDWLQPFPASNSDKGDTPFPLLGTAFYARSTQILADTARVLKREQEAKRYAAEAAAIRKVFFEYYFDAETKLQNAPETQTAYVLAIAFDLVPADKKKAAAAHLVQLVKEAGGNLRTGFLGTPYVVKVLDETGHEDIAYDMLFRDTYPSWFYSIDQGATTLWERWNSFSHEKGFGNADMNSFNHYAYGAIGQWMYERVAGLSPDPQNPGYKHFFVRPLIGNQLSSARAELETPYGKAVSGWKKEGGKTKLSVTVPPNTTATVVFPDGKRTDKVAAGTHSFDLQ